ncbi:hypothetical protein [Nocardia sp. NPDC057440]|uniref:hypothetical protein n=1 Tax=Nocardia sp. NPDC057440 TaxID=3346134 RepID=UPI00367027F2
MNVDDLLDVEGIPDRELLEDLKQVILQADALKPRSLQKALGPSEVGHPCERRLAYGTVAARKNNLAPMERGLNRFNDPLAAIIGTAMHTWLEEAVRLANEALGRVRWIPEQKVEIRPGLSGTCDLYDVDTRSVLDWKVPGADRHKHYVTYGPGEVYEAQAHLYGAGYIQQYGLPVEKVGIVFLSRTGGLRNTHLWRADYNPALVQKVLDKLDRVDGHIEKLNLMANPNGFQYVDIAPNKDCSYCPWFSPKPEGAYQCNAGRG